MEYLIGAAGGIAATLGGVVIAGVYAFRHPQFVFKKMMHIAKTRTAKPAEKQYLSGGTWPHE